MSSRRLLCAAVIESDNFTDMPLSTQALYMHLLLQGDDDGGLDNAKRITRSIGATPEDMQTLIDAGYLIQFESGVIFITHWKVHNSIRKDRYKPTMFVKEFAQLTETEAGIYQLSTSGCQSDNQLSTSGCPKLSKDKRSKDKVSKEKVSKEDPKGNTLAPEGAPSVLDPLEASNLSLPLKEKLTEWIDYKKAQHRFTYKGQGLKSLIRQVEEKEQKHGARAIISLIDECMANGWKGIIWDRIGRIGEERELKGIDAYFALAQEAYLHEQEEKQAKAGSMYDNMFENMFCTSGTETAGKDIKT